MVVERRRQQHEAERAAAALERVLEVHRRRAVALLRYYAQLITETPIEEIRPSVIGHTIVRREPVGVVAAVVPWNYPQALSAFKLAPALAAGCTVVLKAAPETALDALVFAEAVGRQYEVQRHSLRQSTRGGSHLRF